MDTIIRVDRSIRPVYPDWMKRLHDPELEAVGPTKYDLAKIELYLHDDQKDSSRSMKWYTIYDHLVETDTLKNCLGFQDALEILKKNIKVFRELFRDKKVYCWKSIVFDYRGNILVPKVYDDDYRVEVSWVPLSTEWSHFGPAGLYPGDNGQKRK